MFYLTNSKNRDAMVQKGIFKFYFGDFRKNNIMETGDSIWINYLLYERSSPVLTSLCNLMIAPDVSVIFFLHKYFNLFQ